MARVATAGELVKFRKEGQWAKLYAAIFSPHSIYTARINQSFTTTDGILEITYDTGAGVGSYTLASVLPGMTLLIGSAAGKWDIGVVRLRDKDSSKFYIGETTDVSFADNLYLTVIDDFGLWARHILINSGSPFMDGGIAYTNQHTNFDPVPIMGSHRVLKLTGATIATTFDGSGSYCLDSTISSYSWSAPGASATSGMTTSAPTVTYNATGWYYVSLTVTAANGKSFFGIRYVYVWNEASPPYKVEFGDFQADADGGGWQFDITSYTAIDIDTVMNNPLVIIFAEDYYGKLEADKSSIGPLVGSENVVVTGWIARETIDIDPKLGSMKFTGYTAQHWLQQIPAYPSGVRFVTGTSAAWTDVKLLTLNKGLFHHIHWRSTATRIMDVFLTDDTKYTTEVSSLATTLWEQLREMGWAQVYARAGMNCYNQLYIEVHPQLVPQAERSWPVVTTFLKNDYLRPLTFDRTIVNETSKVYLSGITVNSSGKGSPFFSLSPGHGYPHYGKPEIQDTLLLSSQAQANTLAGLYYGWRNNQFKNMSFVLQSNNRLIDCFPRQKCLVTIDDGDNLRGIEYNGGLIPTSIVRMYNATNGYLHTEVTFEAETFAFIAVNGDVPGSGDVSIPPSPSFPPLPDFEFTLPGVTPVTPEGAQSVLFHDVNIGMVFTENFNAVEPDYLTVNAGLSVLQYQNINWFFVTPSGAFYVGRASAIENGQRSPLVIPHTYFGSPFIARAPYVGGTFTIIEDEDSLWAKYPENPTNNHAIKAVAFNPLQPETVAYLMGQDPGASSDINIWIGSGGTFTEGVMVNNLSVHLGFNGFSYGQNTWVYTGAGSDFLNPARRVVFNATGTAITANATFGDISENAHVRAGTTGIIYVQGYTSGDIRKSLDNGASWAFLGSTLLHGGIGLDVDPSGMLMMQRYAAGARGKSADGGATFSTMGSLPVGNWWFSYAGGAGVAARFVAAGGTSIRYTEDFGVTWIEKSSDSLTALVAIPNINMVKVITF